MLGPFLLALVFLAVIGASVGLVLGARSSDDRRGGDAQDTVTPSPSPSSAPPTSAPPASASPSSVSAVSCLAHTEQEAGTELTQLLYLRTERSEVWICQDADGDLYYQGHAGPPGEKLVEDDNALFLDDVERTEFGYRARNRSGEGDITEYLVSSKELIIRHPSGTRETEPATPS